MKRTETLLFEILILQNKKKKKKINEKRIRETKIGKN